MNNLLIDIGNSHIKVGTGNSNSYNVRLIKRFSYSKKNFRKDFGSNFGILSKKKSFNNIGISALHEEKKDFLEDYFKENYHVNPDFVNRNLKLPLKIKYSKGLGNDRICNAVAAYKIFGVKNILIVDFGTATAYTFVSNGTLMGGLISPGIKTSLSSLIEKTTLPKVNLSFPKRMINNNTLNNIKAGVLFQSLFAVERTIIDIKKKYKDLFIVATGGYSNLIAKRTNLINKIDKNLTLKGINIIISQ